MQPGVYQYLNNRPDLVHFIRQNPKWYRKITRDPSVLVGMEEEAKYYFGKTTTQKMERMTNQLQMVQMLMQMAQAMKE
ncbi:MULTISPECIES: YlbE-like family protein [Pontibacillus]|uniref:YlbE-like family protein n=1 Tax=Pontibacillus chungwhensis TaxID=265426 RepID=A0ABY8V222_9BACI|nr:MULTISPECIES: YlbE-like family protein [Pontibacillus]MCD5322562.1 YlbE-like family protein [Pontibacillus sp. HN14]WIF99847.1 YlbE-like family protein [Pontibacillus chungwhensis]